MEAHTKPRASTPISHQQTSEKVSAPPNVSRIPPPGHWFKLTSTCFARQDFAYVYNTVRNSGTCRETLLHMSHTAEKTETCIDDNDESSETDGNDEMCISSPEKDTSFVDVNAALANLEETRAKTGKFSPHNRKTKGKQCDELIDVEEVTNKQWVSTDRTQLVTITESKEDFIENLSTQVFKY